tara:strand:- start:108 stop:569 length:462 start_codon:yes stop_codon:yes gene_type:complete
MNSPNVKGHPLKIFVSILVASYIIGEFFFPKYPLVYILNLIGILGLISNVSIFIAAFNLFKSYEEDPFPSTITNRLIKTGIFAYTRNPIYLAFVGFNLSMFLVFENVMYFLSALGIAIWLHHWVIKIEENYLLDKFSEEYEKYKSAVNRWLFF